MVDDTNPPAHTALIFGCGYLGRRLARSLIADGVRVFGTTRSQHRGSELNAMGIRPLFVSITQRLTFAALKPALEADALDVYYLIPPGRADASPSPRQVILGGIAYTINALRTAPNLRRAVLTSSTAVYGSTTGELVDADTPAHPTGERAQLLLDGERLWLDSGLPAHVVRLAGLYGPDRVVGLSAVRQNAPLLGDPQALLNLIHVDDAADLLRAVMLSPAAGRVELGCDGSPVARIDYYSHLADRLGVPPPRVLTADEAAAQLGVRAQRLQRTVSKACDNIPTCQRTGWAPRYGHFRDGLDAVFAEHAARTRT